MNTHPDLAAFEKLANIALFATEAANKLAERELGERPSEGDIAAIEAETLFGAAASAAAAGDLNTAVAALRQATAAYDTFLLSTV